MKAKLFFIILFMSLYAYTALAQFSGMELDDRIKYSLRNAGVAEADIADNVLIMRDDIEQFRECLSYQNNSDAYVLWKELIEKAPFSLLDLYTGRSPYMFYQLIQKESNAATREVYINDMMKMFDLHLSRLDSLNSFTPDHRKKTRASVLAERAEYYFWVCKTVNGRTIQHNVITLEKAYKNLVDALKEIENNGNSDLSASFLNAFFVCSDQYYKINEGHHEQYIQDYHTASDYCNKILEKTKTTDGDDASSYLADKYEQVLSNINTIYAESGVNSPKQTVTEETERTIASVVGTEMPAVVMEPATGHNIISDVDEDKIYEVVEINAQFPGGEEQCNNWLSLNVRYPAQCMSEGIQGRVIIKFVVEKDGQLTNLSVVRSPDERLSKEAMRVIKAMPKWRPGRIGNKYVRSYYTLPINFKFTTSYPHKES